LDITNDLTLEAWIWIDDTSGAATLDSPVVAKYVGDGANQRAYLLAIDGSTVAPYFYISTNGSFAGSVTLQVEAAGALALDQWYHVAAVLDAGNSMTVYTNGVVATNIMTGVPEEIHSSSAAVWIGQYHGVWDTTQFKGRIDEVAVYNRALSASEIEAHYTNGVFGSAGDYPEAVLDDGPVAYWRMEETSKFVSAWAVNAAGNSALNGNYIQFDPTQYEDAGPRSPGFAGFDKGNEAPYFWTDFDSALNGDDGNYIAVSDNSALDITADLTLEAWIKLEQVKDTFLSHGILGKYGTSWGDERAYVLGVGTATTNLLFIVSTNGLYNADYRIDTGPLVTNQWYHIAAVLDAGDSMRIYTNGVEAAAKTAAVPGTVFDSRSPLWFGTIDNKADGNQFYGIIDEVAVYDKALSESRIQAHYRAANVGNSGSVFIVR
jgi:hypothetical protein